MSLILDYSQMAKKKLSYSVFILLLSSLLIATVSATIYYQIVADITTQTQVSPIILAS
jgi:hypothetical protein